MVIYKITNTINGKIYIGMTIQKNPKTRWNQHRAEAKKVLDNKKKSKPLYGAMAKYGLEKFTFEIIDKAENLKDLCDLEYSYIKKFNSTDRNIGYNIEEGGEFKRISSLHKQEYSKKRSEIAKKQFENPDVRRKMSEKAIKRHIENPEIAKKHSEFQKKRAKDGTNVITKKGKEHPFSKSIFKLSLEGVFIKEYGSGFEAERETGVSQAHINKCCLEKSFQANGFLWIYKEKHTNEYVHYIVKRYNERHISGNKSKKVTIYKDNTVFKSFNSLKELSIYLNVNYVTLSKRLCNTDEVNGYKVVKG